MGKYHLFSYFKACFSYLALLIFIFIKTQIYFYRSLQLLLICSLIIFYDFRKIRIHKALFCCIPYKQTNTRHASHQKSQSHIKHKHKGPQEQTTCKSDSSKARLPSFEIEASHRALDPDSIRYELFFEGVKKVTITKMTTKRFLIRWWKHCILRVKPQTGLVDLFV